MHTRGVLVVATALAALASGCAALEDPVPTVVGGTGLCRYTHPGDPVGEPMPGSAGIYLSGTTGIALDCVVTASDARVSGSESATFDCAWRFDGVTTTGACTGSALLTGVEGTWLGHLSGTVAWTVEDPNLHHDFRYIYVGTGDNFGLRYVLRSVGDRYFGSLDGRIIEVR